MNNYLNVSFKPWIGCNYINNNILKEKILILGESHYCINDICPSGRCPYGCCKENMKEDCFNMTIEVVNDFLNNYEKYKETYRRLSPDEKKNYSYKYLQVFLVFACRVLGKDFIGDEERKTFWNSVIFYNFMQLAQPGPNQPISKDLLSSENIEMYRNSLISLIKETKPEKIIVWGRRAYNMIRFNGSETYLSTDKITTRIWNFDIDGNIIPALEIHHPSCSRGRSKNWTAVYKQFLRYWE
mgnify:CR=1 FL=1